MRKSILGSLGTATAAVLATSCCWLPPLLIAVGAGAAAASVSGFVIRHNALFVVGAIVLLSVGGYFIYFHEGKVSC